MKRVYIAGPYSADKVIDVLDNIRRGMRAATKVLLAGFAPFCPWLDFHFQLMLKDGESLTVQDYYDYSIAWLKVSDAMLVLPKWSTSTGTKKEMKIAYDLKIPIFGSLKQLIQYREDGIF